MRSQNQINLDVIRILMGDDSFNQLLTVMKGQTIYFAEDIESRNERIRKEFRQPGGDDPKTLAKKYGLSVQSIYKILEKKP